MWCSLLPVLKSLAIRQLGERLWPGYRRAGPREDLQVSPSLLVHLPSVWIQLDHLWHNGRMVVFLVYMWVWQSIQMRSWQIHIDTGHTNRPQVGWSLTHGLSCGEIAQGGPAFTAIFVTLLIFDEAIVFGIFSMSTRLKGPSNYHSPALFKGFHKSTLFFVI